MNSTVLLRHTQSHRNMYAQTHTDTSILSRIQTTCSQNEIMISERILLFVFRGLIYVAVNRNPVYSLRIPLRTNMAVGIVIITDTAFDFHAKIIPLYR